MRPKRIVEPKYLPIYEQLNRHYPDRPGSAFDQLFKEACLQQDAEERYQTLLSDAKSALAEEEHQPTGLFQRMLAAIRGH